MSCHGSGNDRWFSQSPTLPAEAEEGPQQGRTSLLWEGALLRADWSVLQALSKRMYFWWPNQAWKFGDKMGCEQRPWWPERHVSCRRKAGLQLNGADRTPALRTRSAPTSAPLTWAVGEGEPAVLLERSLEMCVESEKKSPCEKGLLVINYAPNS